MAKGGARSPQQVKQDFDALEAELLGLAKDAAGRDKLWRRIDNNGNGKASLAEIDKAVTFEYPLLNNKPALMRAYKQTCLMEGGDGDAWVEPDEFPQLLVRPTFTSSQAQHQHGRSAVKRPYRQPAGGDPGRPSVATS